MGKHTAYEKVGTSDDSSDEGFFGEEDCFECVKNIIFDLIFQPSEEEKERRTFDRRCLPKLEVIILNCFVHLFVAEVSSEKALKLWFKNECKKMFLWNTCNF